MSKKFDIRKRLALSKGERLRLPRLCDALREDAMEGVEGTLTSLLKQYFPEIWDIHSYLHKEKKWADAKPGICHPASFEELRDGITSYINDWLHHNIYDWEFTSENSSYRDDIIVKMVLSEMMPKELEGWTFDGCCDPSGVWYWSHAERKLWVAATPFYHDDDTIPVNDQSTDWTMENSCEDIEVKRFTALEYAKLMIPHLKESEKNHILMVCHKCGEIQPVRKGQPFGKCNRTDCDNQFGVLGAYCKDPSECQELFIGNCGGCPWRHCPEPECSEDGRCDFLTGCKGKGFIQVGICPDCKGVREEYTLRGEADKGYCVACEEASEPHDEYAECSSCCHRFKKTPCPCDSCDQSRPTNYAEEEVE